MKDTRKTNEGKLFTEKLYEGNYLSLQNWWWLYFWV
jgi:hypothetical protein